MRAVAGMAGAIAALTAYGAMAGPRWRPRPAASGLVSESSLTTCGPVAPAKLEVIAELVRLDLGGESVWAQVMRPATLGPHPVVVFMHGAGTGNHVSFADHARELAQRGVASVTPDKRLSTYSARHRDYPQMARDYLVAVAYARAQSWAGHVGLYAESESGWIAPMAAADNPDVDFVALISSPVVRARAQFQYAAGYYALNTRVPAGMFHAIPRLLGSPIPGGGFAYATTDVSPYQRRMHQPVFVAYGAHDTSMPIVEGARTIVSDLAACGNHRVVVRYYDGANHGIRVGELDQLAPGFLADLAGWIASLADAVPHVAAVAGAQVHQPFAAVEVPRVSRWGRTNTQLVIAGLGVGALAVGQVAARVGRRRARPVPSGLARPGAVANAAAVVGLVGLGGYLAKVAGLALNYRTDDRVVKGGYAALRVVTAVQAGALATLAGRTIRLGVRRPSRRSGDGAAATWLYATLAGGAALASFQAYYGLFPTEQRLRP